MPKVVLVRKPKTRKDQRVGFVLDAFLFNGEDHAEVVAFCGVQKSVYDAPARKVRLEGVAWYQDSEIGAGDCIVGGEECDFSVIKAAEVAENYMVYDVLQVRVPSHLVTMGALFTKNARSEE